jgi:branched-chain amino acid transport system substrate-binding protein
MISPASSNPRLTELGRANVFRVTARDDAIGIVAGNYLADHWLDREIAILHDDTTYGKGLAEEVKKNLERRGVSEAIYRAYVATMGCKLLSFRQPTSPWHSSADTTPRSR